MTMVICHWSDCAMHSEPAYPWRPCNCGADAALLAGGWRALLFVLRQRAYGAWVRFTPR